MMKSKLVKAFMLGIGLSAFMTNVAFAQMTSTAAAAPTRGEVMSEDQIALYAKQKDIDLYLFADHPDELKNKGFMVTYTVVTEDVVEIGITPYTEENATYLYNLFGKDDINVVEADKNVLYKSNEDGSLAADGAVAEAGVGYADPGVVADASEPAKDDPTTAGSVDPSAAGSSVAGTLPENEQIYTTTAVDASADVTKGEAAPADNTGTDGEMTIQIESANTAPTSDSSAVYETTAAEANQLNPDIRTVAAADNSKVAGNEGKDTGAVDTSMIVLAIAGGAVLIGGGIVASNKKRAGKQ